jgi:hypothetical protein
MTTLQNGLQLVSKHKVATAAGVGLVGLGVVGALALSRNKNKKRSKKSRKSFKRKSYRKQKQPYTARKRKDTSHRRIRYTKNNQPYIILPNGRARFISNKSARNSRKRTGGRY